MVLFVHHACAWLVAATTLLLMGPESAHAAAPMEIMLLTNSGEALERYWPSETTFGVRFNTKDSTSKNQVWTVDPNTHTISTWDGFCVTAASDNWNFEQNLIVLLTKCTSPPGVNQQWVYAADNTFQVTLTKWNTPKTYCLDADVSSRPQNVIHGWDCSPPENPNWNQKWKIFYPGYQIKVGDKCVGLARDNVDDEPLRLLTCENNPLQMWKYDFANGLLRLGDPASAMCVDSFPVGESGSVHMWRCDGGNENQQVDFKITRTEGTNSVTGHFFMRDTDNYFAVSDDGSKLVSVVGDSSKAAEFTLLTELPGDLCAGKTCKNGGTCAFGRCRCPEGTQGDDCGTVGQRVRIRASNGWFLSAGSSTYTLEYQLIDSTTRQQIWYHFPGSDMVKINRRRMCLQGRGDIAELTTCRLTEPLQKWTYDLGTGRLQLKSTNRCLDADVRASNHTARMQNCATTINANQVWEEISPDGTAVNSDMFGAMIRHRSSLSLCWTVTNGQVATAPCQATASQLWNFNDAYTGAGALCNGDLCAVAKVSSDGKGLVALNSYDGQRLDERFEYESATGQIRMANTNTCVAKSSDASNKLIMATCSATDAAQFWYLPKVDRCLSNDFLVLKDKCAMGTCAFGRCQCQPGFEGSSCSYDSCSWLQCNNGGTCALGKCTCAAGYAGTFCDDFVKCKGVKCLNGGACSREGKCVCPVGFSGERCHIKHPNVLLRVLEYRAIGLEGGLVTTVVPDVRKKEHVWVWDSAKTMLRSSASSSMCLEQIDATDLGVAVCNITKAEQKWVYNAAKGKLSTSVGSLLVGSELSVTGRYRPRLATAFEPATGLDLSVVEMDRLDLPGFSIRSGDRSKCLTLSTAGTFSASDCNGDDESQQWEYHPQNGVIRLPRLGGYQCISVSGASVTAAKCNGEDSAQQFDFDFTTKRFRNRKTQSCLVLGAGSLSAAACSDDATQVLRSHAMGFCDVMNMCEGNGVCSFGRCVCQAERSGAFCEVAVAAQ